MAEGGGTEPAKLSEAIDASYGVIEKMLRLRPIRASVLPIQTDEIISYNPATVQKLGVWQSRQTMT